jgi:hypothetical protein
LTAPTTPLSYNAYIQNIGVMAVMQTQLVSGVYQFTDAPARTITPQLLNYAELRAQRDLDLLPSQASNTYTLTTGNNTLAIPIDDFLVVQTLEVTQTSGATVVNATPLLPVSKEFIQNCYAGSASAGTPQYYAMVGDTFGNGANTNNNVMLGPVPNFAYSVRVTGTIRTPSLYTYASAGIADTRYTYISSYYPDLLMMASLIFISAYQRQFSATSDDPQMAMTYEKQYQALRLGAIAEENRKKGQGSGWSAYSTPVSATPTR